MNNRFKIEAKERKCWWVSVYDRQNDEHLNGFVTYSVEEAKVKANKKIEEFLLKEKIEKEKKDLPSDLEELKTKRKEYENQLKNDSKSDFDKEIISSMLSELDKEIEDAETKKG